MNAVTAEFTKIEARIFAHLEPAIAAGVRFYDVQRAEYSDYSARVMAILYIRRKVPDLDHEGAAVVLAEALAIRAQQREAARPPFDPAADPYQIEELL